MEKSNNGKSRQTTQEIINKISGMQTIASIQSILNINKTRAIYIIHRLRKKGYVVTKQNSDNVRIYFIARENSLGGQSYIDILNKYSPIKLSSSQVYKIYGRDISIEETIVYAVKTRKFRYILSSLALFKQIKDWVELYRLAKKNNLVREIGALYNLTEMTFSRIKKMPKYYYKYGLPNGKDKFTYILPTFKSEDYSYIENKWKVHIPFNKRDLEEYLR